jgi:hypothetical protein
VFERRQGRAPAARRSFLHGHANSPPFAPQLLLAHHLKALKLPTFLREYDKLARLCAAEGLDHIRYLLRVAVMLLGCIADDFTGASDLANTLSKGGILTVLFARAPSDSATADCEAGVVALKTRSIAPVEAVAQSLVALSWLKAQECRQILFKYCSTFDSTLEGNIGPVAEALLDALEAPVAVVCPVFPTTGRTLFMGHLFVKDRLLNESGMEKHPLNPMTDSDLRRWLRRQRPRARSAGSLMRR